MVHIPSFLEETYSTVSLFWLFFFCPCSGELRTQKLRFHLFRRAHSSVVLPLKPGVGQYRVIHNTPTTMASLLFSILPVRSPAFFSKTSPEFLLCWLWLTPVPVWARRKNRSPCSSLQTTDAGSRVECLRDTNRLQNLCYCLSGFAIRKCGYSLSCG